MTEATETTEAEELAKAEENYRINASYAAQTARIDYEALLDVGFDEDQALDIVLSWHGKSVTNVGGH